VTDNIHTSSGLTTVLDPFAGSPIIAVGPSGGADEAMLECLLAAPGTWAAGPELGDLLATDDDVDADAIRAALTARFAKVDTSAWAPGATPTMVAVLGQRAVADTLERTFPGARFVLLVRHPAVVVAEQAGSWSAEEVISDWGHQAGAALTALTEMSRDRWFAVTVEDLVLEPENQVQALFTHFGLGWHQAASTPWRSWAARQAKALAGLTPEQTEAVKPLGGLLERIRAATSAAPASLLPSTPPGSLTASDRGLSQHLGATKRSLLVTTYQSNRLITLRRDEGRLGVHLRAFDRPMGIARTPQGFALGVRTAVLDYRRFDALAPTIEPVGRHDAAFVPRNSHYTGDIAVHDLAVGRDGLWVVATTFNCLATLDMDHSFVPRWRPHFVSAIAAEDRCHLNGLALVDGVPRYVTALGVSNTVGGWREDKAHGGVIIDVANNHVVATDLSMPHSPRWHDGKLWFLESGKGHLSMCDPETGEVQMVAELPGFTRGLRLHGRTAYVGTSQIRETATFGGLPISGLDARECGVWAVDTTTGAVIASVVFEDRIQEIFDLEVVDNARFPEVAEPESDLVRTAWLVPAPD
jgi:uncharacterized protein (TIGR03032 family)